MARSSALRAYSHIWEAAEDPDAPLPVVPIASSGPGWFSVATFRVKRTGSRAHKRYTVRFPSPERDGWCSCPWFSDPRNESTTCKHLELVRQALYIRSGLGTPLPVGPDVASSPSAAPPRIQG